MLQACIHSWRLLFTLTAEGTNDTERKEIVRRNMTWKVRVINRDKKHLKADISVHTSPAHSGTSRCTFGPNIFFD